MTGVPARHGRPGLGVAMLLAGFVLAALAAAFVPWTPVRVAGLAVLFLSVPAGAASMLQRRALGLRLTLDLQLGAALAVLLLVLLAVGAVFVGFHLPLHREPLVVSFAAVSLVLYLAGRFLPQGPANPLDTAASVLTSGRWVGAGRLLAGVVVAVCLAGAVVLAVVSQRHWDNRSATTALGIQQTANADGRRSYQIEVSGIGTGSGTSRLVLTVTVTGAAPRTSTVTVAAGHTVRRTISAPSGASISASLARAATPGTPYRIVRIGH